MLAAGIAGGYTTWSTWAWEFLALGEDGSLVELTAHIAGSLVVAWPRPIPAVAIMVRVEHGWTACRGHQPHNDHLGGHRGRRRPGSAAARPPPGCRRCGLSTPPGSRPRPARGTPRPRSTRWCTRRRCQRPA